MPDTYLVVTVAALSVGVLIGKWSEARRWRYNATQVHRIESGGRLFNVTEDNDA